MFASKNGFNRNAAKDAKVTVKIVANNTKIVGAEYNHLPIQVDDNTTATIHRSYWQMGTMIPL